LHRLGVASVGPDGFQPAVMGQEHPMPTVQRNRPIETAGYF
jgi:hypothetical protein